jgi:uncharacterized membrane protein
MLAVGRRIVMGMMVCSQVHGSVETELGSQWGPGADRRARLARGLGASKEPGQPRRPG